MNIKEIRISKGLKQNEAAEYLHISRRSYQNLEKESTDTDSIKYRYYCQKLLDYSNNEPIYHTNVVLGDELLSISDKVKEYKKRFCFSYLLDFMNNDYRGKVCILYGLRRTGKTTLLFQLIRELDKTITAYIKVDEKNNMADLIKDLNILKNKGIKNVFIDEITLLDDFINSSATLSDIYSALGMKIILSGTDSLGFAFSDKDELFDRNVMIHTSYISFKEFSEILGINDIDKYIEYGGTFKIENMGFDDPDYDKEEVAFRNDESTRKYIDTAISKNIQRSLKNNRFGDSFIHLKNLYEENELTNVINRIIENMNHDFLISVITKPFKSSDLGSSKQLLLHNQDTEIQTTLYDIDEQEVIKKMKDILSIKEKDELNQEITPQVLSQIKEYLYMLDLIRDVEIKYSDGSNKYRTIFVQPGMRYSITKALVYSLLKDPFFNQVNERKKKVIIEKMLSDVKGRMLEDIVLLETSLTKKNDEQVFKYRFITGGEFDMVVFSLNNNETRLFEIKHSEHIDNEQCKHLNNFDLVNEISNRFGEIINKTVLYRGKSTLNKNIKYQNVEEYLKSLK